MKADRILIEQAHPAPAESLGGAAALCAGSGQASADGAGAPADPGECDLCITIWPDSGARFVGTAAQIQAEGLVPQGFEFPRGSTARRWKADGFDYELRRTRPAGHRGPMRSWLELDNWCIRVSVTGRDSDWFISRGLERKAEELRAACHRNTAAGRAASKAEWEPYWRAHEDAAFQAFKSLIPGLIPLKRQRKPKAPAEVAQR